MVGGTIEDATALVDAGLWIVDGDGWRIHNWTEYQTLTVSERRAEAGRKGGLVSGQKRSKSEAKPKQTASKNVLLTKQTHEAGTHPDPTRPVKPSSQPSQTETVNAAIDEAVRQRQATTTGIRNPEAWRRTVREQMTSEENAIAKATRLLEQYPTANASQIAAALNGSTVALRLLKRQTLPNEPATHDAS